MGLFSQCFGGCGGPLVPPEHIELSREELKALYERSIALNNGRLIVHGIFARADTKNNNKRVYPKYILKREVAKYEQSHIAKGTALGELDHPNYASQYFKCLNLPNVSHQVLDVQWKGDQLWGTIEVLQTPSGMLLWELYSQGIKLGVSSRGWASLRTDPKAKCVYVDDDFELITFDFVTEPSTRGAYLVPIRKAFKHTVPDQSKAVQIAHLGHGVVSMHNVPRLPDVPTLVSRINELQQAEAVQSQGALRAPGQAVVDAVGGPAAAAAAAGLRPHPLDKLLLHSHYIVFQQAGYLDREQHARDFPSHLAMFATRAHLADQQQLMNRADLNAIILREIAKEEAESAAAAQQAAAAARVEGSTGVGGKGGAFPKGVLVMGPGGGAYAYPPSTSSVAPTEASVGPPSFMHASQSIGDIRGGGVPGGSTHSSMAADPQAPYQAPGGGVGGLQGRPAEAAECQSQLPSNDLGAWNMHPNALDIPSATDVNQLQGGPGRGGAPSGPPGPRTPPRTNQVYPAPPAPGEQGYYASGQQGPGQAYLYAPGGPGQSDERGVLYATPMLGQGGGPGAMRQPQAGQGGAGAYQLNVTAGGQWMGGASTAQQQQKQQLLLQQAQRLSQPMQLGPAQQQGAGAGAGPGSAPAALGMQQQQGVSSNQRATAESGIENDIAAEFQKIKVTLASFATKYHGRQQALAKAFCVSLPSMPQSGPMLLSLTGARI